MVRSEACQGLLPEGDDGRVQLSNEAEARARNSPDLDNAIRGKYGPGARGLVDEPRMVPYTRRVAGRAQVAANRVRDYLDPVRDRLMREARNQLGEAAVRRMASAWTKFVPGLNLLTTLYDVYDLASTGYDIYQSIDEMLGPFRDNPNVYEVRPDLAIEENGRLRDIYDFKFDGDRYRNDQDGIYNEAMRQGGVENPDVVNNGTVSPTTCECDGQRFPGSAIAGS
ncbi:MAG: hypothetical protein ACSHXH_07815 [Marivita sp.]|uniref:hypothetical protein n=1 Tax=Marivita sp. TaxID=2003365 RepID=UPI003EF45250